MSGLRLWCSVLGLVAAACAPANAGVDAGTGGGGGAGETGGGTAGGGLGGGGDAFDAGPADAGLSPVCAARAAALQSALDGARHSPIAALGVTTADCPTLALASGDGGSPGQLFRVASITKTYVAATVVALERAGQLSLDDTLDTWALPVPDAGSFTVRQLLNHTSGLFDYTADPAFSNAATRTQAQTPEHLVALATQHPLHFAPGTAWRYSNTDYILLGMIAKTVTHGSLSAALDAHAVVPAGLEHTTLDGEEPLKGVLAPGYDTAGHDVTTLYDPSWAWAAGAEVATPADLATWVTQLYGGAVLDATGRAELTGSAVATGQPGITYGLGTMVLSAAISGGAGVSYGHAGDINGYHSMAFYFPDKQTAIAVIVDSDAADPNAVLVAAMGVLFP